VFWFIPATHKVVIVALLVIAVVAFVLFVVTQVLARLQGRREEDQWGVRAAVHHGTRAPEPPPAAPRDE